MPVAATRSLLVPGRTTGVELKSARGCVNESFSFNVFGSSAAIMLLGSPTAAYTVPSVPSATPDVPLTLPPGVAHDVTSFLSLAQSSAHTALGVAPQPFDVDV